MPLNGRGCPGSSGSEHLLELALDILGLARQGRQQGQPLQQIMRIRSLQQVHPDPGQLPILQTRLQAITSALGW